MDTKVILADDHAVFRTGLARFLAVEDGFRIIGQCDDLARLYKAAQSARGTVITFAASLEPDMERLRAEAAAGGNRLMAVIERNDSPQMMLREGVQGLIYRDVSRNDLLDCFRSVARGAQFTQAPKGRSSAVYETDIVAERVRSRLSTKELQIVRLLLKGYKNKEIAQELNNTEQVIKNYLRSIFDKTGVSDRLELVLFTIHHKLLLDAVETSAPVAPARSTQRIAAPAALLANPVLSEAPSTL